jgi:hypothetical protein
MDYLIDEGDLGRSYAYTEEVKDMRRTSRGILLSLVPVCLVLLAYRAIFPSEAYTLYRGAEDDPTTGLKKLDLVRYYEGIADRMLPHLKDRPVSLVRAPEGITKELFSRSTRRPRCRA